jgi:DNA-binding transcriptional LysR family regulator
MDHLRLRALTLIETLSETGSLREAARRMHTSQPALTVMLQELERTLGSALFERSRRGLAPTEAGAYLIRQAKSILADLRRVREEFALGSGGQMLLRVGALPLLMLEIVPRALALLRATLPRLRVEFQEGAAADLLSALDAGTLDLVVGRMLPEFADRRDFELTFLFSETFCIIGRPRHPLAGRRKVAWRELQACQWVQSPPGTELRRHFMEAFQRHGLGPPEPTYESASFYSCIAILLTSDCLMLVPSEVGRHFTRQKTVRMLAAKVGGASAPFLIIKRRSRAETRAVCAFEEAVRQALLPRTR